MSLYSSIEVPTNEQPKATRPTGFVGLYGDPSSTIIAPPVEYKKEQSEERPLESNAASYNAGTPLHFII